MNEDLKFSHHCQVCERESPEPISSRQFLTGHEIFMCRTCWAIWYDGEQDITEIKRHSLYWPVNDLSAYRKSSYGSVDAAKEVSSREWWKQKKDPGNPLSRLDCDYRHWPYPQDREEFLEEKIIELLAVIDREESIKYAAMQAAFVAGQSSARWDGGGGVEFYPETFAQYLTSIEKES